MIVISEETVNQIRRDETRQRTPWCAVCEVGKVAEVDEGGGEEDC